MEAKRRFVVTRVQKTGQKGNNTGFDKSKSYAGKTPVSAAKKAHSDLCRSKKTFGQCALNVSVSEIMATPTGSPSKKNGTFVNHPSNKEYKYRIKRMVNTKLVNRGGEMIPYKYTTKARSLSKKNANTNSKIKF